MADKLGWTAAPNTRGTIDIIWNVIITVFLCCWSTLVINVPTPGCSRVEIIARKLVLVGLGCLAPEIILQIAIGQWLSARRSVKLFHEAQYTDWTIEHGFYADMGGLHLVPSNWKSFPINAEQLLYLIKKKNIPYPRIRDSQIQDKDKLDGLLRLITLFQAAWLFVNVIARAIQGLAITAWELSTSAFILLSVGTTFAWRHKPADVMDPEYITTNLTIEELSHDEGKEGGRAYRDTPLDHVGRYEWSWSILWAQGLNYLRRTHLTIPDTARPITRFHNSTAPVVDGWGYFVFFWLTMAYLGIFSCGWNFDFPTQTEGMLWRAASLTSLMSTFCMFLNMRFFFSPWYPPLRQKVRGCFSRSDRADASAEAARVDRKELWGARSIRRFLAFLRNSSAMKDPEYKAPLGAVLITWFCGIFYCASRAYILIADIIELRSLPASAYQTVEWSAFWPHF